jgi:hypothetical protein
MRHIRTSGRADTYHLGLAAAFGGSDGRDVMHTMLASSAGYGILIVTYIVVIVLEIAA